MKRKINKKLLYVSLIPVLLACVLCIISAATGSVYIRTNGTPAGNINNLLTSILSGDGDACVRYTDSYQAIDFDASEEDETVRALCSALFQSYAFEPLPESPDGAGALTSADTITFSCLDLQRLFEMISPEFENYVYDTAMESDSAAATSEGEYLPEVYEKAFTKAVQDVLMYPEDCYTSEKLQLTSYYRTESGEWRTGIDSRFAGMLLGGLSEGIMSDTLSVPKAVRTFVSDSLETLKGGSAEKKNSYSLPYSSTVGPKPDASKYIRFPATQADQVMNLVAYARSCGLLKEQSVIFDPEASFYPEDIICYCDETILVICWKEYINGSVANCMEVKIADGSQIKRKITGDTYNSGILDYMSHMSAATNAVAAVNGDYYAYRFFGTTVYQGQLHRYDQYCELLMIDDQGRFIFFYPDGRSFDALQAFIDENHVQFGLAFGPVLIEDYTPRYYTYGYAYGLGQMTEQFTRAAFGEYDDLHYLFMTSGYAVNAVPPADLDAFIEMLRTKNLKNAYNLDGGQTAEIVIQNTPYNQIDYRAERQMSDMIFFATAIPEGEDE